MGKLVKYIGLDLHKNSISIAIANQGRADEVGDIIEKLIMIWISSQNFPGSSHHKALN